MIKSKDYPEKSPEWTLAKFFEAWAKRNWNVMTRYCQLSWIRRPLIYPVMSSLEKVKVYKQSTIDVEKILSAQFRHKLLNVKILKTEKISDVTRDISVEIFYKDINIIKKIRRKARLICETGPMEPSLDGQWGVNPTSMTKARR